MPAVEGGVSDHVLDSPSRVPSVGETLGEERTRLVVV